MPDNAIRRDVDIGACDIAAENVRLSRAFTAKAGRRYVLEIGPVVSRSSLRVNAREVAMFRYLTPQIVHVDLTEYLDVGENVIQMDSQQLNGLRAKAALLEYDPASRLEGVELTAGISSAGRPPRGYAGPVFWRAQFAVSPAEARMRPLRLRMTGMGCGHILLNGRHCGKYWQVGPQDDYNLPSAWLRPRNELVIVDFDGACPDQVEIVLDETADKRLRRLSPRR